MNKAIKKALIIVDSQYDFMPGGSLPVKDGDKIVPIIKKLMQSKMYSTMIFTMDCHDQNHCSFLSNLHKGLVKLADKRDPKSIECYQTVILEGGTEQTMWPDHCVNGTDGQKLHKDIL